MPRPGVSADAPAHSHAIVLPRPRASRSEARTHKTGSRRSSIDRVVDAAVKADRGQAALDTADPVVQPSNKQPADDVRRLKVSSVIVVDGATIVKLYASPAQRNCVVVRPQSGYGLGHLEIMTSAHMCTSCACSALQNVRSKCGLAQCCKCSCPRTGNCAVRRLHTRASASVAAPHDVHHKYAARFAMYVHAPHDIQLQGQAQRGVWHCSLMRTARSATAAAVAAGIAAGTPCMICSGELCWSLCQVHADTTHSCSKCLASQ